MERIMDNCFYNEDKKLQCSECGSTEMTFYACMDGTNCFGYKYQCGNGHICGLTFMYDPVVNDYESVDDGTCVIKTGEIRTDEIN